MSIGQNHVVYVGEKNVAPVSDAATMRLVRTKASEKQGESKSVAVPKIFLTQEEAGKNLDFLIELVSDVQEGLIKKLMLTHTSISDEQITLAEVVKFYQATDSKLLSEEQIKGFIAEELPVILAVVLAEKGKISSCDTPNESDSMIINQAVKGTGDLLLQLTGKKQAKIPAQTAEKLCAYVSMSDSLTAQKLVAKLTEIAKPKVIEDALGLFE